MICESQGATAQGHKTEFNEGGVSERAHEPCWLRGRRAHPRSVCEIQVCRKGAVFRNMRRDAQRPRRPLEAVL